MKFKVNPRLIYEKNKKKFKKFELQIFIKIRKKIRKKQGSNLKKIRNPEAHSLPKVSYKKK